MRLLSALPLAVLAALSLAGVQAARPVEGPEPGCTPAGERLTLVDRSAGGLTVLPSGRFLTPRGIQIETPPHPYGMVLSRDGKTLVGSCNGVGPFALVVVTGADTDHPSSVTLTRTEIPEMRSLYRGLALSPDGKTLYASGGNDGGIHVIDLATRKRTGGLSLNTGGYADSLSSDLALSPDGNTLIAVDAANFRLAFIDTRTLAVVSSVKTGRYPFAVAFSPDGGRAYVANIGLFEYRAVEKAPGKDPRGVPFPGFGYPSREAREGTVEDDRKVPGLGPADTPDSYSVWGYDLTDLRRPKRLFQVPTGIPVSTSEDEEDDGAKGGSVPCALAVSAERVYVSNANNDSVQALDGVTGKPSGTIELSGLLPKELRTLRGLTPYGLAIAPEGKRLYAALAGFNAVAVVNLPRMRPLGMFPTAWYPARLALSGGRLCTACAKGFGSGPNGGPRFRGGATAVGSLMHGSLSLAPLPDEAELRVLTLEVLRNNGALSAPRRPAWLPPVKHVLFITKENRTFDEVFGGVPGVRGDSALSRFGTPRPIPGVAADRVIVMPNHLALAWRFGISDNFYVDSDHSADGHRWLVGVPPNHWTESLVSAAYGGQMSFRADSPAPGRRALFEANSSAMPEDYLERGTLWHHLARNRVTFRNWGEGIEFAGISEEAAEGPTGAREPVNIPMPMPLFRRTARDYPVFNTYIPDQYRADVFLREWRQKYEAGKEPLPSYMYLYLPNDHGSGPRPNEGYPVTASYMADNDLALGRIVEAVSHSRFWKDLAIVVTEDDAQGGVDSVDAHRSLLMVISPWVKRGVISRQHADLSSIHHAAFELLKLPALSLYDGLAGDLRDFWSKKPDLEPYNALTIDPRLFDPVKAQRAGDPQYRLARRMPHPAVDDPDEVERWR